MRGIEVHKNARVKTLCAAAAATFKVDLDGCACRRHTSSLSETELGQAKLRDWSRHFSTAAGSAGEAPGAPRMRCCACHISNCIHASSLHLEAVCVRCESMCDRRAGKS